MRPGKIKEVTLGGQEYRVKEFTPEVACFWAFRLFGSVASALTGDAESINQFINMNRRDFNGLMLDCLSVVSVKMESGTHPFFKEDGGYAIPDVPPTTVFQLVVEAFSYSIAPFLQKEIVNSLKASLLGSLPTTGQEIS